MYRYAATMRPLFFLMLAAIYASGLTSAPAVWAQASPAPASCSATFAKISSAPASGQPALEKLVQYLAKHPGLGHRVEFRPNGLAVLEIDYLERSQQKFMTLALRAIREGSLTRIDTGTLVGPKALPSILALAESAGDRPIKIHGFMMVDLANDVPTRAGLHTYADGITEEWTALEIRQFQNAHARLRFGECEAHTYICPFSLRASGSSLDIQYGNP